MKLISSILSIIISVALFFTVINPLYSDIKQLKIDTETYDKALNNSTELQNVQDSLVSSYKKIKQSDKDRLSQLLPDSINNIELILEIEKIANLHGLPIKNIKFNAGDLESDSTATNNTTNIITASTSKNLDYGIFPLDFSIEGNYDTFISFLKDLELNLRIVDVKEISFSSSSSSSDIDSDSYSYSLKVQTYWLK